VEGVATRSREGVILDRGILTLNWRFNPREEFVWVFLIEMVTAESINFKEERGGLRMPFLEFFLICTLVTNPMGSLRIKEERGG
jgi:hypothetical protein